MGSCQNYGPFLGTLNIRRIVLRTQKGTIISTTTHMGLIRLLNMGTFDRMCRRFRRVLKALVRASALSIDLSKGFLLSWVLMLEKTWLIEVYV